jgi:SAM-dependent methyltransferase
MGFFHSTHYNWDQKTWVQNREEILHRELFLGLLGDVRGKKILEVGCGGGAYMLVLKAMGADVAGQDILEESLAEGRKTFADLGIPARFALGDASKLQFDDEEFDCVISADVYEHISLEVKRRVTAEIYRVLKPGGVAAIKTPNLSYLKMVIWGRRLANLLRLRSPFVYIAHTRDNPDREHHGLTTYSELDMVFSEQPFTPGERLNIPLKRGRLHIKDRWRFPFRSRFNEHLMMRFRKSMVLPVGERLNRQLGSGQLAAGSASPATEDGALPRARASDSLRHA